MREDQRLVEEALERLLPGANMPPTAIHEAMRYSVFAGGKRFRPILLMESCRVVGGEVEKAIPAAAAMEMIHTYSLIHDDLPCMDDASLRRGKPTCHTRFGEAIATLAGDGLLTLAFEVLACEQTRVGIPAEVALEVTSLIAHAAGVAGMVGGQVLDIQHTGNATTVTREELFAMHHLKTGALIEASVTAGALIGGATPTQRESLARFGRNIGLAFQIADDLLDVEGAVTSLGKDIAADAAQDKVTFPAVFGITSSRQMAADSLQLALEALQGFGEEAEYLRSLARFVVARTH